MSDDVKARALHEIKEDRRIATLAMQEHTKNTLLQRAQVTADLLAALEAAEAERDDLAETLMHAEDLGALYTGLHRDATAERDAAREAIHEVRQLPDKFPYMFSKTQWEYVDRALGGEV